MNPQTAGEKPANKDWMPKRALTVVPPRFLGARSIIQASMTGDKENRKNPRIARPPMKKNLSRRTARAPSTMVLVRSPALRTGRLPFLSETTPVMGVAKIPARRKTVR